MWRSANSYTVKASREACVILKEPLLSRPHHWLPTSDSLPSGSQMGPLRMLFKGEGQAGSIVWYCSGASKASGLLHRVRETIGLSCLCNVWSRSLVFQPLPSKGEKSLIRQNFSSVNIHPPPFYWPNDLFLKSVWCSFLNWESSTHRAICSGFSSEESQGGLKVEGRLHYLISSETLGYSGEGCGLGIRGGSCCLCLQGMCGGNCSASEEPQGVPSGPEQTAAAYGPFLGCT